MSKTYHVDGMTCGGCGKSLTTALTKAAPDAKINVDHATGKVTIDGDVPVETIRAVVEAGGFDFMGEAMA